MPETNSQIIGLAAFAAASIAMAPAMATGWAAMRFGWSAYVIPVLFAFSPSLILIGETTEIIFAVTTAGIGVWLVSSALAGYFTGPLTPSRRFLFALAGLLTLIPSGAFPGAVVTDILGISLGAILLAVDVIATRRNRVAEVGG